MVSSMPSGGHAATLHSHQSHAMGSSKQINGTAARRNQVNKKGLRVELPVMMNLLKLK